MMKYINASVTQLLDSAEDAKSEIWEAVNTANKKALKDVYKRIFDVTETENKKEKVNNALKYLLNNWTA